MFLCGSETVLAEMGVALREDSTLVGVFSPRKVDSYTTTTPAVCHLFSVMHNADIMPSTDA